MGRSDAFDCSLHTPSHDHVHVVCIDACIPVLVRVLIDSAVTPLSGTRVTARIRTIQNGCCFVRVTYNGQDFSALNPASTFRYDSVPYVTSVQPSFGPVFGGTVVVVTGTCTQRRRCTVMP